MTITLTDEQQKVLAAAGRQEPIRVVDSSGRLVYTLVRDDVFERFRALLSIDEFQPQEAYSHMDEVAGREGWRDPEMDAYDQLDPRFTR